MQRIRGKGQPRVQVQSADAGGGESICKYAFERRLLEPFTDSEANLGRILDAVGLPTPLD